MLHRLPQIFRPLRCCTRCAVCVAPFVLRHLRCAIAPFALRRIQKAIPCKVHPRSFLIPFLANSFPCKYCSLRIPLLDFLDNSIPCKFTQMRIVRPFLEYSVPCNFHPLSLQIQRPQSPLCLLCRVISQIPLQLVGRVANKSATNP